jgi:hypothetical protein
MKTTITLSEAKAQLATSKKIYIRKGNNQHGLTGNSFLSKKGNGGSGAGDIAKIVG